MSEVSDVTFSLRDQAFLKELGISCMAPGLEFMLREHEAVKNAEPELNKRAEGYQSLDLDQATLQALSEETGETVEEIRNRLSLIRDLKDPRRG
ncbi:hypothetical protein [Acanthopleuribacter pedis]|uniref:Uncharacterized protein n=1 Tax=Acanthopleuribacter pedis TaxID=442870 RepID=A0A8J7QFA5_9BACT|nr:hypothetical protein [Acanthopleuribacter pedis]MBO1323014.1 hypothetical protein [Acanthopleuribacter pedis]